MLFFFTEQKFFKNISVWLESMRHCDKCHVSYYFRHTFIDGGICIDVLMVNPEIVIHTEPKYS